MAADDIVVDAAGLVVLDICVGGGSRRAVSQCFCCGIRSERIAVDQGGDFNVCIEIIFINHVFGPSGSAELDF